MKKTVFAALVCFGALTACGGSDTPDQEECTTTSETQAAFCDRMAEDGWVCGIITAKNSCGLQVSLDCGTDACTGGTSCGSDNKCSVVCETETKDQFCARMAGAGKECGTVSDKDVCQVDRTEDCGQCTGGQTCSPANKCEGASTCPITDVPATFTAEGTYQGDSSGAVLDVPVGTTSNTLRVLALAGYGVFTDGLKTGTFTLSGDDLNYATCGICLLMASPNDDFYFPIGGQVQITNITDGLDVVMTNVQFQHVDIDWDTFESTPNASGCKLTVESATLSTPCPAERACGEQCCDLVNQTCEAGTCVEACFVGSDLGTLGTLHADELDGEVGSWYYGGFALNGDVDALQIEMYSEYGVFANGLRTGTFTLAGDELQYASCGLCVLLWSETGQAYMPTGGTVTVTSIDNGFEATLENVTFGQVTIAADFTSTPVPGGCQSQLPSATLVAHPPFCGDGARNGTEACEGTDLGGKTCESIGFNAGTIACTDTCTFDTTDCSVVMPDCAEGEVESILSATTGLPLAIPDATDSTTAPGAPVSAVIAATGTEIVKSISVQIDVDHTFDRDLVLSLEAPGKAAVKLADRVGSSGDNFTGTWFSDTATTSISNGVAPFYGIYLPSQPLSGAVGAPVEGDWKLTAQDFGKSDTGTVKAFKLRLCLEAVEP